MVVFQLALHNYSHKRQNTLCFLCVFRRFCALLSVKVLVRLVEGRTQHPITARIHVPERALASDALEAGLARRPIAMRTAVDDRPHAMRRSGRRRRRRTRRLRGRRRPASRLLLLLRRRRRRLHPADAPDGRGDAATTGEAVAAGASCCAHRWLGGFWVERFVFFFCWCEDGFIFGLLTQRGKGRKMRRGHAKQKRGREDIKYKAQHAGRLFVVCAIMFHCGIRARVYMCVVYAVFLNLKLNYLAFP